ncbi:unnamed protein product, partial [Meganyctiphanes norvegica]
MPSEEEDAIVPTLVTEKEVEESDEKGSTKMAPSDSKTEPESDIKKEVPISLPLATDKSFKATAKNCFRLVILGSSRVGKTSIVSRFLNNKFDDTYTPTIEDFHRKLYRIRGDVYQLDILDTSGNHPFPAMRRLSFLTGDLFILVFSVDSVESWEEVVRLREQILETKASVSNNCNSSGSGGVAGLGPKKKRINPRVPLVIAANKADKDRVSPH